MITVYQLKTSFQNLLRPICANLAARGVTANQVTIAALAASVFYGLLLTTGWGFFWLLLPLFLLVRMALNAIDGMLAREHNMKTRLGMALNELGDVVADTALFLPFMIWTPSGGQDFYVILFAILAILTEFCGLLGYMMSGVRRYNGPMGKSDRAVATGILGFLIGVGVPLGLWLGLAFTVLSALCVWTCYNRIKSSLNETADAAN